MIYTHDEQEGVLKVFSGGDVLSNLVKELDEVYGKGNYSFKPELTKRSEDGSKLILKIKKL